MAKWAREETVTFWLGGVEGNRWQLSKCRKVSPALCKRSDIHSIIIIGAGPIIISQAAGDYSRRKPAKYREEGYLCW